jgi:hypothetical protein
MNWFPYHLTEENFPGQRKNINGRIHLVLPASLEPKACRTMSSARNVRCTTAVQPSRAASHACLRLPTATYVLTSVAVVKITCCLSHHTSMRTQTMPAHDKHCQGDVRNRRYLRIPLFWSTVGLVASWLRMLFISRDPLTLEYKFEINTCIYKYFCDNMYGWFWFSQVLGNTQSTSWLTYFVVWHSKFTVKFGMCSTVSFNSSQQMASKWIIRHEIRCVSDLFLTFVRRWMQWIHLWITWTKNLPNIMANSVPTTKSNVSWNLVSLPYTDSLNVY